jgi:hypothetical protein
LNPPPSSARFKSFSFLNEMPTRNSSLPISSKIEIYLYFQPPLIF